MRVREHHINELVSGTSEPTVQPSDLADLQRGRKKTSGSKRRDSHSSFKGLLRNLGALDLLSAITARDRAEIFLYHGFCPGQEPDPSFPRLMPIDLFEEHIRICSRFLRPLSLKQVFEKSVSGVVITFDDGYANNYELAFPILQKYGFPATIFLTTGFLDQSTPLWGNWLEYLVMQAPARDTVFEWNGARTELSFSDSINRIQLIATASQTLRLLSIEEIHDFLHALEGHLELEYNWERIPNPLRPLTWEQVRTMHGSGLISFGAHTLSHPVLSRCSEETQTFEILQSKSRIEEELGEECAIFAYPYGKRSDYTPVTREVVRRSGFKLAVTAEPGSTRPSSCGPYEVPRWGADLGVNELSFLVSGGPILSAHFRKHLE